MCCCPKCINTYKNIAITYHTLQLFALIYKSGELVENNDKNMGSINVLHYRV